MYKMWLKKTTLRLTFKNTFMVLSLLKIDLEIISSHGYNKITESFLSKT